MFDSPWIYAVMTGVFSMFPESFLSSYCTTLFGPRSDDPVIDLTANSTLGITTLSIALKITLWTPISTAITALSTSFLILSAKFLSITRSLLALCQTTIDLPNFLNKFTILRPYSFVFSGIGIGTFINAKIF